MLQLEEMDEKTYQTYIQRAIPEYAEAHMRAGNWKKGEALKKAREQFEELLPQGLYTKDHHLRIITDQDSQVAVGILWFGVATKEDDNTAFIYDLWIDQPYRGRGYGHRAMQTLEGELRDSGVGTIYLHVFADNEPAMMLYRKLNFSIVRSFRSSSSGRWTSFQMAKGLAEKD
jgi:ribosomal protein S18 acetylase RimI-like enzyme